MSTPLSLVIDADIARSAGGTEHPVSSGSRKLLECVSNGGHTFVICPTLLKEWKKHRSKFATQWMTSMYAKRKIMHINPTPAIANHISENISDGTEKDIALKDAHLLDAAFEADKIVASNDGTARAAFCKIAESKRDIRSVLWLNAVADREIFETKVLKRQFTPDKYYLRLHTDE